MSTVVDKKPKLDLTPGKRCSDFDEDCAKVRYPLSCWLGGIRMTAGIVCETPPADGYCPYVIGQLKRQ